MPSPRIAFKLHWIVNVTSRHVLFRPCGGAEFLRSFSRYSWAPYRGEPLSRWSERSIEFFHGGWYFAAACVDCGNCDRNRKISRPWKKRRAVSKKNERERVSFVSCIIAVPSMMKNNQIVSTGRSRNFENENSSLSLQLTRVTTYALHVEILC